MSSNHDLDIQIDELRLDKQWQEQPSLYHRYALELADAQREYQTARAAVDVAKAEVALDARRDPSRYGLEKTTEATIAEAVAVSEEVRAAVAHLIDARHDVDVLQAVVSGLDHRKKALENLVLLHLSDYWSTPRAPRGEAGAKVREQVQGRAGKAKPRPAAREKSE